MEILEHLWNTHLYYGRIRINMFGIPRPWKHKEGSYRSTMSRLHKKGFIKNEFGKWMITKSGKEYFQKNKKLLNFNSFFEKNSPKNLLLMFDVPESRQNERKWLRQHLKKFKYSMIQKSVWVGPSPLPKEFIDYTKKIKLKDTIKTFKLEKGYNRV